MEHHPRIIVKKGQNFMLVVGRTDASLHCVFLVTTWPHELTRCLEQEI